jgi:RHS repeat-associated protein
MKEQSQFNTLAVAAILCLLVLAGSLQANTTSAQEDTSLKIAQARIFDYPLSWSGTEKPIDAESQALWKSLDAIKEGSDKGIASLESFIQAYPKSGWTPSLRSLLAQYYRRTGRYSLALCHWQAAWDATKEASSGEAKKVADMTFAHWVQLLTSLGRTEMLQHLFKETETRVLDRSHFQQMVNNCKEALSVMLSDPGRSYKCGVFALGNVAKKLTGSQGLAAEIMACPSPQSGFSMKQLAEMADHYKLDLIPVSLGPNAEIVAPSVVHWHQNHYAAILERNGNKYKVVDSTFGEPRWFNETVIRQESSGHFMIPSKALEKNWTKLSDEEMGHIYGKGYPNAMPDQEDVAANSEGSDVDGPGSDDENGNGDSDGDGDDDGDSDCFEGGMPVWGVSQPYMSIWLYDKPLYYTPSKGPELAFKLNYHQRDSFNTSFSFNTGPNWECSWLSFIEYDETRQGGATLYVAGGGTKRYAQTVFDPALRTYTARGYPAKLYNPQDTNGNATLFIQAMRDGSTNIFRYKANGFFGSPFAQERFYLSEEIDAFGRTNRYEYDTTNSIVRLKYLVDRDGQTNIIRYDTSDYTRIAEVQDPYRRVTKLYYNVNGFLSSCVDVIGISNSFVYRTDIQGTLTNLHTPYGDTYFKTTQVDSGGGNNDPYLIRTVEVIEPNGAKQLYLYLDATNILASSYSSSVYPADALLTVQGIVGYGNYNMHGRNTFHWGLRNYPLISSAGKTNVASLTTNDLKVAHLKHWLHGGFQDPRTVENTLGMERLPSPDGVVDGQTIWYNYDGKTCDVCYGLFLRPSIVAKILPDGTTNFIRYWLNDFAYPTQTVSTFSVNGSIFFRTNVAIFSTNNVDIVEEKLLAANTNVFLNGYAYNVYHQMLYSTNAVGEVTEFKYDSSTHLLSSVRFPSGLTRTNIYASTAPNWLLTTIDVEIGRTNNFTYTNGLVYAHTDERGNTSTNSWDSLQRLTKVEDGRGYISLGYSNLDLVSVRNPLGYTNSSVYDSLRHLIRQTDPRGKSTSFARCDCGALSAITNALGEITSFNYDYQGRLTSKIYADGSTEGMVYDSVGRVVRQQDVVGNWITNFYNNQGLLEAVSNSFGLVMRSRFDFKDRKTNMVDATGVNVTNTFDALDRLVTRSFSDGGTETFAYSTNGLRAYTNQIGDITLYTNDTALRLISIRDGNSNAVKYSRNAAGDLLTLTDGKNQTTQWKYDLFGRATNRIDAANVTNFLYTYDSNDRLASRWTPAKGLTLYARDQVGNLTNVHFSSAPDFNMAYDALNRLTTMVDAVGTCSYSYSSFGAIATEDGPWDEDTVTYSYVNQRRTRLSVQQAYGSPQETAYGYDAANRLKTLTATEGAYVYSYAGMDARIQQLSLPNGAYITNRYDSMMRMLSTYLKNSTNGVLNSHAYGYNAAGQRLFATNTPGNYTVHSYDRIGQLKIANSFEPSGSPRLGERFGYAYDEAGNLGRRTNNTFVTRFLVDNVNQLTSDTNSGTYTVAGIASGTATNVTVNGSNATLYLDGTFAQAGITWANGTNTFIGVGKDAYGRNNTNVSFGVFPAINTFIYDLNGNLVYDGRYTFGYDEENQLTSIMVTNSWLSTFSYDAKGRRRVKRDFGWNGAWVASNEVRYVYSGNLIIQERNSNNILQKSYTRGPDIGGALETSGGIGGLLSMTLPTSAGPTTFYYHSDARGNVSMLINGNSLINAFYAYDPFGRSLAAIGPLAEINTFRFSSKEAELDGNLYNFGRRFYNPSIQKWMGRDPILESGGLNLYGFVGNAPENNLDNLGFGYENYQSWKDKSTVVINGKEYSSATKSEFVYAIVQATQNGEQVKSFIYNGHSDAAEGTLILGGLPGDHDVLAEAWRNQIPPLKLEALLEALKNKFDSEAEIEFNSCGSANPMNPNSPGSIFKKVFPDATVTGYTGYYNSLLNTGVENTPWKTHENYNPKVPQYSEKSNVK